MKREHFWGRIQKENRDYYQLLARVLKRGNTRRRMKNRAKDMIRRKEFNIWREANVPRAKWKDCDFSLWD